MSGRVIEAGTKQAIQNATVTLVTNRGSGTQTVIATRTDSEGNFILYYKMKRNQYYALEVRHDEHWNGYHNFIGTDGKDVNLVTEMNAFAWFKLRTIKKTYDKTYLHLIVGYPYMPGKSFSTFRNTREPFDITSKAEKILRAEFKGLVSWAVFNDTSWGGSILPRDEIFVKKNDTLIYTVEFD